MSMNRIIYIINETPIALVFFLANLALLWVPIFTFIPNPKITYFVVFYLLFILGGHSYQMVHKLFGFPGSHREFFYFERTRFILSLSSLTFLLLWIFINLKAAYLVYSIVIIISIIVYFYEIIIYPKFSKNKVHKSREVVSNLKRQEENEKLREKKRWDTLSLEGQCSEICNNIRYYINSDYLNKANSLLDEWREEIIDIKGSNYFNSLINLYNNKLKQNGIENSREYNWQCSKCGTLVKQHHQPSGSCNDFNRHRWVQL